MKKEWVQFSVAIAVALTAGAVIRVAENEAQLGSLGEWVSGIGAIMAAVIALWIADNQRRHAIEQFAEERRHASEMAADERRYQEALSRMARDDELLSKRRDDYKTAHWMFDSVVPGIRSMDHYIASMNEHKKLHSEFSKRILDHRSVTYATNLLNSINGSTFSDLDLLIKYGSLMRAWNNQVNSIAILQDDLDWTEEEVGSITQMKAIRDAIEPILVMILSYDAGGKVINKDNVSKVVSGWSKGVFKSMP